MKQSMNRVIAVNKLGNANHSLFIYGQRFGLHVRYCDVYIASLLSAAYYKTFSFYFKFLGEPWEVNEIFKGRGGWGGGVP